MMRKFMAAALATAVLAFLLVDVSDAAIPPTRAFMRIFNADHSANVTGNAYNSNATFTAGQNMVLQFYYENNTIRFSSTGTNLFKTIPIEWLANVTSAGCAAGEVRVVNATGWWVCGTSSGEANTASNIGIWGQGFFASKTGVNLDFKRLVSANSNCSLSGNSTNVILTCTTGGTDTNTAQIAVSGTGVSPWRSRDNATQNTLKSFTTTRGLTITGNADDVQFDTNFKVNSKSSATRQFLTSFNNATTDGNFGVITFGINNVTTNCSGTDKVSSISINNSTGAVTITCSADSGLTAAITSINSDTTASQVFSGTANNVTITDTGAGTLSWNLGSNVVTTGGSDQTFSKNILFGSLATMFGSDPADSGSIRLSNAQMIGWEASPAGTDVTVSVDSSEDLVVSTGANNINLNSNPLINSILNIDSTGNQITASTNQAGDLLKSDGTEYQRFARGGAGTCLKVNAGGTDLEYGSCGSGGGFTTITNLSGGTAKILHTNSSNKAEFKSLTQGQGMTLTNGSSTVTIATSFKIDNLSNTCSGTDKVSSITFNNSTGDWTVTCSADNGGSGGSGIPKPTQSSPKKWGQVIPISTSLDLVGLLQSATLDGTETYTYNTARNTGVISSACGTTAGGNCGVVVTATNRDTFRRDQNPYLYADVSMSAITGQRMFIGFRSGTTALPNNADTIVNALSAFGICIRTTDTLYQRCENDGSGAGTYTSLGVTEDTNFHTFEIYAVAANNQWCVKVDGGTASCATTDIPAATTRMWVNVEGETSDTTSENFIYANIYVENDM